MGTRAQGSSNKKNSVNQNIEAYTIEKTWLQAQLLFWPKWENQWKDKQSWNCLVQNKTFIQESTKTELHVTFETLS